MTQPRARLWGASAIYTCTEVDCLIGASQEPVPGAKYRVVLDGGEIINFQRIGGRVLFTWIHADDVLLSG